MLIKNTNRRIFRFLLPALILCVMPLAARPVAAGDGENPTPNIVLIMTDDQGWGQTGYYDHPVLRTPNLDAMAANGLRFDRFYAAAPVCSPTRASVLTGRTPDRSGVRTHGFPLRHGEKTLSEALAAHGYATGHFGKWHLNGIRGRGIPIYKNDAYGPGMFGFEDWVSVTNFFDLNPLMSDNGKFKRFEGSSSDVIVDQTLEFIRGSVKRNEPFFAVIWDGSPHRPWRALPEDREQFSELNRRSRHHYGELAAFDRSVGTLRRALREMNVAENTLVWFCSDNGGLPGVKPGSVGGLRGHKGSLWEGGIRVPAIVEWPAKIEPRVTKYPASTMDIFPTIVSILDLPESVMLKPVDGISLADLFEKEIDTREKPIGFRRFVNKAMIDNDWKIKDNRKGFALYNLAKDPGEQHDVSDANPDVFEQMVETYEQWEASVRASERGADYPDGHVKDTPDPIRWTKDPRYKHFRKRKKK